MICFNIFYMDCLHTIVEVCNEKTVLEMIYMGIYLIDFINNIFLNNFIRAIHWYANNEISKINFCFVFRKGLHHYGKNPF